MKYKISVELWDGTKLEKIGRSWDTAKDIQDKGFYHEEEWVFERTSAPHHFLRKLTFYPTTAIRRVDINALPPE